jgi:hypothetical protein
MKPFATFRGNGHLIGSAGMIRQLASVRKAVATQGLAWGLKRAQLALQLRLGIIKRRTPVRRWSELPLSSVLADAVPSTVEDYFEWRTRHSPHFLFRPFGPETGERFIGADSIQQADAILSGTFPFFAIPRELGFPPPWRPAVNGSIPSADHWTKVKLFDSGDIKIIWEPNRFSWAFNLARAYLRSGDNRYAEGFWQLFENWLEANPPNAGENWVCGQEAAFRAIAMCFAYHAFLHSPSTTSSRTASFVIALAVHARRINAYLEYALSQKNNHGISECVGLWTLGVLFPEIRGAARFKRRGISRLVRELRRQSYSDGSYVQHSFNYHRVMLQDVAWAIRLGEVNGTPLPQETYEVLRRSTQFLREVTDPETGWAPNHGANDGALVLPLSDCAYPDMRPVLQSCSLIADRNTVFPSGPWDEEMVWMNGVTVLDARPVSAPRSVPDIDAIVGGYYTIRSRDSWLMVKGAKYRDRPSQADQLHVDGWWRGVNILCDPGTYSYNASPPFDEGFAATRHHNTVVVDGCDQMNRVSRFLWGDWANAEMRRVESCSSEVRMLQARHDGYAKFGVSHSRLVAQIGGDIWVVVDDLTGDGIHDCTLQWLAPDVPLEIQEPGEACLSFPAGKMSMRLACSAEGYFDCIRAGERVFGWSPHPARPDRGWISRYYAQRTPALSFALQSNSLLPIRFLTIMTLGTNPRIEVAESLEEIVIDSTRVGIFHQEDFPALDTRYETKSAAYVGSTAL